MMNKLTMLITILVILPIASSNIQAMFFKGSSPEEMLRLFAAMNERQNASAQQKIEELRRGQEELRGLTPQERSDRRWEKYIAAHTQPSRPGSFDFRGDLNRIELEIRAALALRDPAILRIRCIIDLLEDSSLLLTCDRTSELITYLRQLITNNAEVRADVKNAVVLANELLRQCPHLASFKADQLSNESIKELASTVRGFLVAHNID